MQTSTLPVFAGRWSIVPADFPDGAAVTFAPVSAPDAGVARATSVGGKH